MDQLVSHYSVSKFKKKSRSGLFGRSTVYSSVQRTEDMCLIFASENINNPLKKVGIFTEVMKTQMLNEETTDFLQYHKIKTMSVVENLQIQKNSWEFNSNFDSGNLGKVFKYKENEFVLVLRKDFSNENYSHWFYFSVIPEHSFSEAVFHIANISKKDSALLQGMQIVVRSGAKWERGGKSIRFKENTEFLPYTLGEKGFSLSFSYGFTSKLKHFFAYTYPYTYQDLIHSTSVLSHKYPLICNISELCKSLSGLSCPLISITSPQTTEKKVIFFMGRVHPCEAPSSHIINGLLKFLTSSTEEAENLRNHFIFKIIPMLNPDGVKFGNTRCSLLGVDLNRRWISPSQVLHPEIFFAKNLIRNTQITHEIAMICDVHSHAKKKNAFIYGCSARDTDKIARKNNSMAKLVPVLLAKKNSHFSFKDSHFKMDKYKEATARIALFKEFGIVNSYTVETSYFGSESQKVFELSDWENLGCDLARTCFSMVSQISVQNLMKPALEWIKSQKRPKKQIFAISGKLKKKGLLEPNSRLLTERSGPEIRKLNRYKSSRLTSPDSGIPSNRADSKNIFLHKSPGFPEDSLRKLPLIV